ncbi:hypothetical protein SNE40_003785 [Patella caerulea]|uniref:Uncharacterized protein n=1 Tax=Patella caerulea TaxID=87958 RepID=A0AAN8K3P0_PATCE
MVSRRIKYYLPTTTLLIILCTVIYYFIVEKSPLTELHTKLAGKGVAEGRVYGHDKHCTDYISTNKLNNMKRLLNMKTTKGVEDILYGLGYPKRTTTSGDVYIPDLPDPKVHIPDIPVIVAGASSNHFNETQAMMYNIDTVIRPVYPHIKVILYDIGFTELERQAIIKYGRCELRTFNFTKYPDHIRYLHTCSWKPIIIQEVLNQHGFTMYMDASIRLKTGNLTRVFNQVKRSGINAIYIPFNNYFVPNHTFSKTFEYFKTKPCLFHGLDEIGAGFAIVVKNNLYAYTIMRSWLVCSLQRNCVMPKGTERITYCSGFKKYHKCHRNDQSALSIAVYMTNHDSVGSLAIPKELFSIHRGQVMQYFH